MKPARKLLVVDDDPGLREWLVAFGERLGYAVRGVETGEAALEAVRRERPDLVTLDVLLPGIDGMETLRELKKFDPGIPVVMISGHGSTATVVEAVRLGAANFLRKPFEPEELEAAFERAHRRRALEAEVRALRRRAPRRPDPDETPAARFLAVGSRRLAEIERVVDRVADTDITVLIRGESGTGKELIARTIYERSPRARRAFVKVNCAALPAELLESELFGYEKGAFTGAQRRKLGKFEVADGGTIFLDEVSEMHPNLQAKLLQVLQDGQFSRLGGEGDVRVDARVLAASNGDLEQAVSGGLFREDLFYRLNVVTITVPPLRERSEEIPGLADYFLKRYADEFGKEYRGASPELLKAFGEYPWPGNVRELENLVKRMVVLGSEQPVLQELTARGASTPRRRREIPTEHTELDRLLSGALEKVSLKQIGRDAARAAERRLIERVLQRTRWNRKEAAAILQISYKALLYKMKDAGLADSA